MMKKNGFTLIELLAVIVIISIITLIAIPVVMGVINSVRKESFKVSANGIIEAATQYYGSQMLIGNDLVDTKIFTFLDGQWIGDELLINGSLPDYGKIEIDKKGRIAIAISTGKWCALKLFSAEEVNIIENVDEECAIKEYKEKLLNGAYPSLANNMIPVIINNNGTVIYADINSKWYEYENKVWANAVVVQDKNGLVDGDVIKESNILGYFVWIPRYKYQLFNVNGSLSGGPREIQIKFESNEADKSNGSIDGTWLTHPSFTFGDDELNGYWVGKFETGYQQGSLIDTSGWTADNAEITTADINGSKILIKPNIPSWRRLTVSNIFSTVKSMAVVDSRYNFISNNPHMMKNIEWGAVAYLSHSVYGKNGEININNCSNYITGVGDISSSALESSVVCTNAVNKWNGSIGKSASTTGNISGIYDMAGGAWEYVAGVIRQDGNSDVVVGGSGFINGTTDGKIDSEMMSKYFDKYGYNVNWYHRSRGKLGDATIELGPWADRNGGNLIEGDSSSSNERNSWYTDYAVFPHSTFSWFTRGGMYNDANVVGTFAFGKTNGAASAMYSFRIVVLGN